MIPFSILMMRFFCTKGDNKRDAGLTTPKGIVRYDNIDYGAGKKWLLDVYKPENNKEKMPVIVSIHGGGWQYGDKERYQYYCMDLALRGFAVVNFTYHLIPEYRYPQFIKDAIRAFAFVKNNADKYGFDLDHLYAVGDSAGSHMLAQYCIYGTNEEYRKIMKIDDTFFIKPKAVGLNCGIYVFEEDNKREISLQKYAFPKKTSLDEILKVANLLPYINNEFPPAFIVTAPGDFLMYQQPLLHEALNKAGVENELHIYGDETNPLTHVFHCNLREPFGIKANDEECEFFRKHN